METYFQKGYLLGHIIGEEKKISLEPFAYSDTQTSNGWYILNAVIGDGLTYSNKKPRIRIWFFSLGHNFSVDGSGLTRC